MTEVRQYPSVDVSAFSLREAREWRRILRTERAANGAHPQLDVNITAIEHHINALEEEL